ncbi:hypothetical protein PSACC_00540 [Paramicrosporidium saccamoebae]|uniref:Uncharacterized protein n=1 Tax=Paramicrosporidium saccamoebae TaxID=1246581 RepID=A0A2H9TPP2_9FUNG|nr:hypothetical protein PSACC_00540 [Paramicrosporidium saccamoebae]
MTLDVLTFGTPLHQTGKPDSMACDFFYPNMGGVENHLYNLSQCMLKRGHKVVIITHAYGDRNGVRWLSGGLKVYYMPIPVMFNQVTFPTIFSTLPLIRSVLIRERITHLHGHQVLMSARVVICRPFLQFVTKQYFIPEPWGFPLLKFTLSDVDSVICVSNTSKENTVLRAALDPERVFVIPNAVLSEQFTPDPSKRDPDHSTQIGLKGVDLLLAVIPRICAAFPKVRFLIAGDGPKKVDLEQLCDEHLLHNQVNLIGAVASEEAQNIMVRGHIFLNTSLTEAFCMAIIEAASCGLFVVSTKVGGVPEVLPSDMIELAMPEEDHLTETLAKVIIDMEAGRIDTSTFHDRVARMYSWQDVAQRTEDIYFAAHKQPRDSTVIHRMAEYYGSGPVLGKIACVLVMIDFLLFAFLDWLVPRSSIDVAPDFPYDAYYKL